VPERGFSVLTKPVLSPQHNQGSLQELSKSGLTAQSNDSPFTKPIPLKHRHSAGNGVLLWLKLVALQKTKKRLKFAIKNDQAVVWGMCKATLLYPCLIYLFLKCHFTTNT